MFEVQHYKYVGTGSSSERTYDLVAVTPTSDIHPSFLIRRWGKEGTKGSAKVEMFDRASRAKVGMRAEIKKREDKAYKLVDQIAFSKFKGSSTIRHVRELCLPMLDEEHHVFQTMRKIENVGQSEEDRGKLDEVRDSTKLPEEKEAEKPQYKSWGTW